MSIFGRISHFTQRNAFLSERRRVASCVFILTQPQDKQSSNVGAQIFKKAFCAVRFRSEKYRFSSIRLRATLSMTRCMFTFNGVITSEIEKHVSFGVRSEAVLEQSRVFDYSLSFFLLFGSRNPI